MMANNGQVFPQGWSERTYKCGECGWSLSFVDTWDDRQRASYEVSRHWRYEHPATITGRAIETPPAEAPQYTTHHAGVQVFTGPNLFDNIDRLLTEDRDRAERCAKVWRVLDRQLIERRGW